MISDFLLIRGHEFFPAIPPCSAFEVTDDYDSGTLLEFSYLPDGAERREAWVATCPNGDVYSTGAQFDLTDRRSLSVSYYTAPYSYPVVLGDPSVARIEAVDVNGYRGLLILPVRRREYVSYATLRFWIREQVDQKSGGYIEVGILDNRTAPDDLAALLRQIGEGVVADFAIR